MQRSKQRSYSITSSARASTVGEISSPSAFAVFMLMTSSHAADAHRRLAFLAASPAVLACRRSIVDDGLLAC